MTAYDDLMAEDAPLPEAMLGDKGYDSDAIRSDLERRGIDPVIPTKSNRRVQRTIDKAAYAMRNRIKRFFNKSSTHAAWRPATTSSRPASSGSCSSQQSDAGSGLSTPPSPETAPYWRCRFAIRYTFSDSED